MSTKTAMELADELKRSLTFADAHTTLWYAERIDQLASLAQDSQARTDGGADNDACWNNFNNLMHVTDWLIARDLAKFTRTEEKDGPLAAGMNITDSIEAALDTPPGNATQAAGALHLCFCLDADDTFHATLIRKEENGTATVLMSNYCHIKKGRDYLMTASPAVELKKD